MNKKTQGFRATSLLIYICLFFLANFRVFHQLLPPNTGKGLWFYSGIASLLLGSLIVTPFFTKPADAISYSVAAGIALFSTNNWAYWGWLDKTLYSTSISFCFIITFISFCAILSKDSSNINWQKMSNTMRILSDFFGSPGCVFNIVVVYALVVFHRESILEISIIGSTWVFINFIKPLEQSSNIFEKISKIWSISQLSTIVGDVVAYQTPGIALIRQRGNAPINVGTTLLIKDPHAPMQIGVALDYVGRDEALLIRTLTSDIPEAVYNKYQDMGKVIPEGAVVKCDPAELSSVIPMIDKKEDFVGIVAVDTSIRQLYFEVIQEKALEEGKLVQVFIKDKPVIYQIMDGLTKEEIVYQKNTFGYVRAKAQKIGIWDESGKKFMQAKWLPKINSPVYIRNTDERVIDKNSIGFFPGSNYNVYLKDIDHLVTHNTAILGILGVGKTMLSMELVERMIAHGIKIICVDLTEQYSTEFKAFYDNESTKTHDLKLNEIGNAGKANVQKNLEEGGSINEFATEIAKQIKEFIDSDKKVRVFNPSMYEVWRQDSKPFQDKASMATLTPSEITRIISEVTLSMVQEKGITDKARVCLVYEEAHSLIPEFSSIVAEGDKAATNGTARAILQGRKYGLGCLLITQRTANVTKTILNQCNTIFAMRTFDETGKDFLSNYIGNDFASILPSLPERHAIFYGKASSCENPVLIRLNNREAFLAVFRPTVNNS